MRRPLRIPALIVLPLLLVVGLLVQAGRDDATEAPVRVAELTPTAAEAGTPSSTWYCAAGSATGATSGDGAGPAEQTVIVANGSETASVGRATIYPLDGEPTTVPFEVGAHDRISVDVAAEVTASWASVLVEATGGEITVAHELVGPTGRSLSDCSSTPSATWYFPAGTTRVGSDMWLALFNPFPGEATVDVSFDTDGGARTPQAFQGVVVPGESVVVKRLGVEAETLPEEAHVATTISVRSGRIVAEQIQSFVGRDDDVEGLTATIGATTPASIWTFPTGAPADVDAAESVAVFNPGDTDTDVLVQVQLDDPAVNGTVEPFEVTIPAHRFAVVDVSADERVPPGVPHWIVVRTPDGSNVVAEHTLTGSGNVGIAYAMGLPVVATRWLASAGVVGDTSVSQLAVANPSPTETATVTVRRRGGGSVEDIATALEIAPGEWAVIDLLAAGLGGRSSVEVSSDVPVAVSQWMAFSTPADVAVPVGVPISGTQSVPLEVVGPTVATDEVDLGDLPPVSVPVDTGVPADDGSSATTGTSTGG